VKVTSLSQVILKASVFICLSFDRLFNFLLSVNEIQVPLFKFSEYLEHLIGIIEIEVFLPQLVRKVN